MTEQNHAQYDSSSSQDSHDRPIDARKRMGKGSHGTFGFAIDPVPAGSRALAFGELAATGIVPRGRRSGCLPGAQHFAPCLEPKRFLLSGDP
jgi:hypothetical protein